MRIPVLVIAFLLSVAGACAHAADDPPHMATVWKEGDPGEPLVIRGLVMDATGAPLAGARIDTRQAGPDGNYGEQFLASMVTNDRGEFLLRTARPGNYGRPDHIHVYVSHPSGSAFTEILFKGDPLLAADQVEEAIALEKVRIDGKEHEVGTFELTLTLAPR